MALVINGTKLTGRMFKAAIAKYLAHRKEVKARKARDGPVKPCGKQSVKELIGQNQGVSNVEVTDPSIRQFDRVARKYGVDYAIKRDRDGDPPRFLIFFKSRDTDALNAAFAEYTAKTLKRDKSKPSLLARLTHFKEVVKNQSRDTEKHRQKGGIEL